MKQIILSIRPAAYIQDVALIKITHVIPINIQCFRHTNNPFLICIGKHAPVVFILVYWFIYQSIYVI